jgi:hypothetical protein
LTRQQTQYRWVWTFTLRLLRVLLIDLT